MSEIYDLPGHLIRRLHQISAAIFADRMAAAAIEITPVQFAALATLDAAGDVDQATLAGLIAYDRVTMGGVLDRLEQKGLIARAQSPRDRRARIVSITQAGIALLRQARPVAMALQGDILTGLDDAERAQLVRLMRKAADSGNDLSRAPMRR